MPKKSFQDILIEKLLEEDKNGKRNVFGGSDLSGGFDSGFGNNSLPSFGGNDFGSIFGGGANDGATSVFGGGGAEAVGADGASGNGFSSIFGGSGSSFATPLLIARLIGEGKKQENLRLSEDPDDPLGNALLGGLAPSGNQIMADPVGMGLPTLAGFPFLTPFTGSDKAKQTKPEFAGLLGF